MGENSGNVSMNGFLDSTQGIIVMTKEDHVMKHAKFSANIFVYIE